LSHAGPILPKQELAARKAEFVSSEAVLKRAYAQRKRFLALAVNLVKLLIYRIRGTPPAWLESMARGGWER
jgi:hypothetical protein